jgi:hypothetical protein
MHITIRRYKTDSPKEAARLTNEGFIPLRETAYFRRSIREPSLLGAACSGCRLNFVMR